MRMSEKRCLDVGGTFIKCDDGRQVPTCSGGSLEEIAASLKQAVGPVDSLKKLGIAIPGPFDYREGIFLMKHKFAAAYGMSFRDLAGIPPHVDVKYQHDVNSVLAGSMDMLGLKDCNCALVTLGTGLGYTYAVKGEVQCNEMGSPARGLWNRPWEDGILEDRISARGIRNAYEDITGDSSQSVYGIAQRAYAGEEAACRVFRQTGKILAPFLKEEAETLGLSVILFGGQISKSLALMIEPMRELTGVVQLLPAPEGAVFRGLDTLFEDD